MSSARRFSILIVLLLTGVYLYKNILPSFFPLQHTVSQDDLSGRYVKDDEKGVFHGQVAFSRYAPESESDANVLGQSQGNKRIEVDLTNQRLYAFEGDKMIYNFVISSGLYDWTPRGIFRIWIKLRYAKMEGGSRAFGNYYYLPNVPYIMYFANGQIFPWRGFGIHGTYWHNDFGRPKSHGCINLRTEDAEKLFYWTQPFLNGSSSIRATSNNPGTFITIYGKYRG